MTEDAPATPADPALRRILIAEDIADSRQLLAGMLRQITTATITFAKDGEAAIEAFRHLQPHISFIDINMPGKDGLTVLQEIRALDKTAFVVIVSAHAQTATIMSAVDLGADGFVVKPFTARRILDTVQRYVTKSDDNDFPLRVN